MKDYYVYMMAGKRNGTLYTGITNDLVRRVYEHKKGMVEGFTKQYGIKMLVWYEHTNDLNAAIAREKNIQAWKRAWKLRLIEDTMLTGKIYTKKLLDASLRWHDKGNV